MGQWPPSCSIRSCMGCQLLQIDICTLCTFDGLDHSRWFLLDKPLELFTHQHITGRKTGEPADLAVWIFGEQLGYPKVDHLQDVSVVRLDTVVHNKLDPQYQIAEPYISPSPTFMITPFWHHVERILVSALLEHIPWTSRGKSKI